MLLSRLWRNSEKNKVLDEWVQIGIRIDCKGITGEFLAEETKPKEISPNTPLGHLLADNQKTRGYHYRIGGFMSHKIRLNRLEKMGSDDRIWALIGIGKPRDAQYQRILEIEARQRFYASGGNREAYLDFLPFDSFPEGFFGYVKKSEFIKAVTNKTKNLAEN